MPKKKNTIVQDHAANFEVLKLAVKQVGYVLWTASKKPPANTSP
jgi:hypothetical protein